MGHLAIFCQFFRLHLETVTNNFGAPSSNQMSLANVCKYWGLELRLQDIAYPLFLALDLDSDSKVSWAVRGPVVMLEMS